MVVAAEVTAAHLLVVLAILVPQRLRFAEADVFVFADSFESAVDAIGERWGSEDLAGNVGFTQLQLFKGENLRHMEQEPPLERKRVNSLSPRRRVGAAWAKPGDQPWGMSRRQG